MASSNDRRIWRTKRALIATLLLVVWVPGCVVADLWQINVALSGDNLAWLYSVEWPVFALLGIVAWWFRIHDDPENIGRRRLKRLQAEARSQGSAPDLAMRREREVEDEELRAYNDYLASLADERPEKSWRRKSAVVSNQTEESSESRPSS